MKLQNVIDCANNDEIMTSITCELKTCSTRLDVATLVIMFLLSVSSTSPSTLDRFRKFVILSQQRSCNFLMPEKSLRPSVPRRTVPSFRNLNTLNVPVYLGTRRSIQHVICR